MVSKNFKRELPLHLMLVPGLIVVIIFSYVPMVGVVMAFQRFLPARGWFGSPWIGLDNFEFMLRVPDVHQVLWNTVFIASMKIIAGLIVPIFFALLLNEFTGKIFKRTIQTVIYLPFFLSWVILGGILIDVLSPSEGVVNQILGMIGIRSIFFLGDPDWFPFTLVITDTWRNFGFGTIIYLAALTGIDPTLYEAAIIDGASRWKQTLYITIPGIMSTIVLMATLSLGNILNAGFDQVFNLINPLVYSTGDILDTFVFRLGLVQANFSLGTAVGLFSSVVSFVFITLSYKLAYKYANYRIF